MENLPERDYAREVPELEARIAKLISQNCDLSLDRQTLGARVIELEEQGKGFLNEIGNLNQRIHTQNQAEIQHLQESAIYVKQIATLQDFINLQKETRITSSYQIGDMVELPNGVSGTVDSIIIKDQKQLWYVIRYWARDLYNEVTLQEKDLKSMEHLPLPGTHSFITEHLTHIMEKK